MADRADGRRQGQGESLEEETRNLFQDLGYNTQHSAVVWGREADVVAVNPHKSLRRLVAQSKDYKEKRVQKSTIWRLISVSKTLHAHPVLVHNTRLSKKAKQISKAWNVICIESGNLELDVLPNPEPVNKNQLKFPEIIGDTLPSTAQIKPIYDPYHPKYFQSRFPAWDY